jgi:class 3 adenylate cyclase/predicted metal-dependent HD superfamily phosphohydrolase/ActR/RegA family two-component response regulator
LEHFINILLLDQNKTIIAGLKTILSSGGNNLIVCQTISEAIKQIEKREIGIILINISDDIDDSLKQLDQLRQCENENSFYTLLICNKNISEGNIVKGFNKGAVDYIKHPFNPNLVKAKINVFKTLYFKDIRINQLLNNIFPQTVLDSLNTVGKFSPKRIEEGTVLFTDFIAFSKIAKNTKPLSLIKQLERYFNKFDEITERYQLEKIKTIGDAYMALAGVTEKLPNPSVRASLAALEMRDYIINDGSYARATGEDYWDIRIGIHSGPLVAGIIGNKKMSFDVWGDTVNIAARAEQNSETNSITITEKVAGNIISYFNLNHRGEVIIKYGDAVDMYFLESLKAEYSLFNEGKLATRKLRKRCGLIGIDFEHTRRDILNKLKSALPDELVYHDIKHTLNVEQAAIRLAKLEGIKGEELFLLRTAVLFHDSGFIVKYDNNEDFSVNFMEKQLPNYGYTDAQINTIKSIILSTKRDVDPKSILEQIICDADHDYLGRADYFSHSNNLRIELADNGKKMTDLEWIDFQLDYLVNIHKYYTETARNIRNKGKQKRIEELTAQKNTFVD